MHGLINRSIQSFLEDTYGPGLWAGIADESGAPVRGFEAMLSYDDALTERVIAAAARRLDKPREAILEDVGGYLVRLEPIRRLLRFGGSNYAEFLQSLDELPERAHLALPDLGLPAMALSLRGSGRFHLTCRAGWPGFAWILAGVLRAMADDYGALALIDVYDNRPEREVISVELLQAVYARGRGFSLAREAS